MSITEVPAAGRTNNLDVGMKMDFKLSVLTLNCWGIVGVSRHRKERMSAIAAHVASSKYDFVFLQEILGAKIMISPSLSLGYFLVTSSWHRRIVLARDCTPSDMIISAARDRKEKSVWSKDDFQMIRKKCAAVLPYSHYFYSGVIGSGLCILSKASIIDSAQYHYTLNGFAHKILHGDWFGGKVAGLCKVLYHGLKVNLYITHLHAEYNHLHDQYLPHRIVQAFEFSQFVKMTSESADLSIIAGDLNTESHNLPYQIIINNVGCIDSFFTSLEPKDSEAVTATCGHPSNLYTSHQELLHFPSGKRIDYVMYKCGSGTSVKCLSCETPLKKVPNSFLPYSDHEAVVCCLHIFKSSSAIEDVCEPNPSARLESLNNCREVVGNSILDLQHSRCFYAVVGCVTFVVMLLCLVIRLTTAHDLILRFLLPVTTGIFLFCIWMATVVNKIEYSALVSSSNAMEILINSLVSEYGFEVPVPLDSDGHSDSSKTNSS